MARQVCPHCSEGFISLGLLETHIRFVHPPPPGPGKAQPVPTQVPSHGTGYLAMISATRRETEPPSSRLVTRQSRVSLEHPYAPTAPPSASAEGEDGKHSDEPTRQRGASPPGESRFRLSGVLNRPPIGPPRSTPSMDSMMGMFNVRTMLKQGQEVGRVTATATGTQGPSFSGQVVEAHTTPSAPLAIQTFDGAHSCFTVVYEAPAQRFSRRLDLPNTTPWSSYLGQMETISTPVASLYLSGRSTGFRLEDGAWHYSLVDSAGLIEARVRRLTSNLFYQAMISELLRPNSPWKHAHVWNVGQVSNG